MITQIEEKAELRLSLEELALTFSLLGQAPLAKTMLTNRLGETSVDELRGRVRAAGNSLWARGVFRLVGDKPEMNPAYADVIRPMLNADYALQCTTFGDDMPGRSLMIYVQGDRLVEHIAHSGVYHSLQTIGGLPAAVDKVETFFQLPPLDGFRATSFTILQEQAQEARLLDAADAAGMQQRLIHQGVHADTAAIFAEDLGRQQQWAVAMSLRAAPDGNIRVDIGYEALAARSGRTWLMTVDDDNGETSLNVRPAKRDEIRDLTRSLLAHG